MQPPPFSFSLCNLLHSPVTLSLLGLNILLNNIFLNTPTPIITSPNRWPSQSILFYFDLNFHVRIFQVCTFQSVTAAALLHVYCQNDFQSQRFQIIHVRPSNTATTTWFILFTILKLKVGRPRVRFPMVSFELFIDITLPVALWPWGWLSL